MHEKYYIDKAQDENGTIYHTLKVQKRTIVACKAQNKLGEDSRVAIISLVPSRLTILKRSSLKLRRSGHTFLESF